MQIQNLSIILFFRISVQKVLPNKCTSFYIVWEGNNLLIQLTKIYRLMILRAYYLNLSSYSSLLDVICVSVFILQVSWEKKNNHNHFSNHSKHLSKCSRLICLYIFWYSAHCVCPFIRFTNHYQYVYTSDFDTVFFPLLNCPHVK